ncbi:MAG: hypothetical protein ACK5JT_16590 [Hyphomicrobiaceae bacterium]
MNSLRKTAIFAAVAAAAMLATPANAKPPSGGNNGLGIGFGGGNGNGKGNGGGGAAPLPVFGVTLLGQAVGAGGLFFLWSRRRKAIKPTSAGVATDNA